MLRQGAAFDIPSISVPRETSIGERQKGEGREKNGKGIRGSGVHLSAFSILSNSSLSRPYLPYSIHLLPVYSHVLTLVPCSYLFFFFVPEGNTEHLLREIKKKRLSGADARLRSSRCTRRRNDNSSRRILAFLIYWLLAHAIRSRNIAKESVNRSAVHELFMRKSVANKFFKASWM